MAYSKHDRRRHIEEFRLRVESADDTVDVSVGHWRAGITDVKGLAADVWICNFGG